MLSLSKFMLVVILCTTSFMYTHPYFHVLRLRRRECAELDSTGSAILDT